MKIYTKTGDNGFSDVLGKRVEKSDLIFDLIGTVDKLNAVLGLAVLFCENEAVKKELENLQEQMVKLNGTISGYTEFNFDTSYFEGKIDFYSEKTTGFSLYSTPQNKASAFVNLARTICRDAERIAVKMNFENENIVRYLNRMSDYLYSVGKYLEL